MIVLLTDFGYQGPYTGQIKAVLAQAAPQVPLIELFSDLPVFDIRASAHLLAAYQAGFPEGTVFLCVVDPGVGSAQREPLILHADGRWYVGPGNGLFDVLAARSAQLDAWTIHWQPEQLSATFHGRDLFAPVAAQLASGSFPAAEPYTYPLAPEMAADLAQVIYVDYYGNLITGLRAASLEAGQGVVCKGKRLTRGRTFSDVAAGEALCYENSSGLLEIAVNCGRADELFAVAVGEPVTPA